jgi:tight adherence protein C
VIMMMVLAAGVGVGLWLLAVWLFPPPPPLATLISSLHAAPAPPPILATSDGGWAVRMGRPFLGVLRVLGLPGPGLVKDLAVTGRSIEVHLAEKAALALTGLVLPTAVEVLLALGGRALPWLVPLAGSVLLAVLGFLLPDATVRSEATQRRSTFRHALSAYLNLIHILLTGGAGVDGALSDAVSVGRGWSFQQLRRALTTARLTRTTPWATLGQLGEELDVTELSELAAALSLAGTEGAKVRASLAAKAAALRTKGGNEAEKKANSATERMVMPGVLMGLGFVFFIFYPAMVQILSSLHH